MKSRCPKCEFGRLKNWEELNGDERLVVLRLPIACESDETYLKQYRYCVRCWHVEKDDQERLA